MVRRMLLSVLLLVLLAVPVQALEGRGGGRGQLDVEARPKEVLPAETVTVVAEYAPEDESEPDEDPSEDESEPDEDPSEDESEPDEDPSEDASEPDVGEERSSVTGFTIDFGDGSEPRAMAVTGEGRAVAEHAYEAEGTYEVTVRVDPAAGDRVEREVKVRVRDRGNERLEGPNRFGTATRLSREDFPADGSAEAVLLARADQFADALASAGLAVLSEAPVLLTNTAEVPAEVLDEIARALGSGGTVYLLGGDAAIAPSVADSLAARGYTVQRIAGTDRVETALRIAEFLVSAGVEVREVVVASAADFPDALAGAAYAAHHEAPVLLTSPTALDPRVADFLRQLDDVQVLVTGGPASLGDQVVADLRALGLAVERLHGRDRFDTSAAIAAALFDDADTLVIATGRNFPDALAAAAAAGRRGAPILLVGETLPDPVRAFLTARAGRIERVYVLGGPAAVPPEGMAEIEALLGLER